MAEPEMEVRKFVSRGGIRVYGMPVETFPGHANNIYPVSAATLQASRNRYRPLCFLCSRVAGGRSRLACAESIDGLYCTTLAAVDVGPVERQNRPY